MSTQMQMKSMKQTSTQEPDENEFSMKREILDMCEVAMISLIVVVLVFTFIFRIVGVKGDSMMNTLSDGDRLIISHMMYEPEQGDIVVVELKDLFNTPIIKRVIAVEGQTVDIDDDGNVYVDGIQLSEDYIHDSTSPKSYNEYPLTVPEDSVFVMGDNRNNSTDSRDFGCVNENNILGKVIVRLFPITKFGLMN